MGLPPGIAGFICGVSIFVLVWVWVFKNLNYESFTFEPRGPGSFTPLLEKYTWLAQFIIGLSTGSILLLAGTSVFKSAGTLPWIYASPLVLFSLSVVYGVCFLASLFREYENYLHGFEYSRGAYSRNIALGFSALLCFAFGYMWLAFRLTGDTPITVEKSADMTQSISSATIGSWTPDWISAIAACAYTVITLVAAGYVYRQLRAMQEAGTLEAFKTFMQLWDDTEVRAARRCVYRTFRDVLKMKDEIEKQAAIERIIGGLQDNDHIRKQIDMVIDRSNLVGLLWAQGFFSRKMRQRLIGYIYKTTIATWDCLAPYIEFVRKQRAGSPGSITYAAPFEELLRVAEDRLGNQPRPIPSEY